jgi:hypothetical protein
MTPSFTFTSSDAGHGFQDDAPAESDESDMMDECALILFLGAFVGSEEGFSRYSLR